MPMPMSSQIKAGREGVGLFENALSMLTSAAGEPAAGMFALAELIRGGDSGAARDAVRQAFAYQPRTDAGQRQQRMLGELAASAMNSAPVRTWQRGVDIAGRYSPAAGAALQTIPTAIGVAAGAKPAMQQWRALSELAGLAQNRMVQNAMVPGSINTGPIGRQKGVFAGVNALNTNKVALAKAQDMAAKGASPDDIWMETEWALAPDGKWRFEIDDSKARIRLGYKGQPLGKVRNGITENNGWMRLGDVLEHDALFTAYPQLAELSVKLMPADAMGGARGLLNDGGIMLDDSMSGTEAKSVLLHEIQHAIQEHEGFAAGGSSRDAFADPRMRPGATKAGRDAAFALLAEKLAELKQPDSIEQFARNAWGTNEITKELEASYADYVKTVSEAAVAPNIQRAAQEWAAKEWYRRLAGEVEARNVQARMHMTAQERRAKLPRTTADVAEGDQIARHTNSTNKLRRTGGR